MLTFNRILCPIDFSDASKRALRYALAVGRWHDAEVSVLHVEDALLHAAAVEAGGYPATLEKSEEDIRRFVHDAGGDVNVRAHVTTGRPVSGILEHAAREAADLIVLGTHGRTGLARVVLGSVAEGVVRQAPVPVLTIPPSADDGDGALVPFDPILCASDFSAACRRALDLAILMGQEADARVIVLHALQRPAIDPGLAAVSLPALATSDAATLRDAARARLERGLGADASFRCRPEAMVVEGRPADAILDTASRERVRLIVMGVEARGPLDRLLFGSTTRRVLPAATCPVLTVRADKRAAPWPEPPAAPAEAEAAAAVAAAG